MDQIVLRQCKKKARQMQYEVRYVAISTYYHDVLGVKMTKEEARRMGITLERPEFLAVSIKDFSLCFHILCFHYLVVHYALCFMLP